MSHRNLGIMAGARTAFYGEIIAALFRVTEWLEISAPTDDSIPSAGCSSRPSEALIAIFTMIDLSRFYAQSPPLAAGFECRGASRVPGRGVALLAQAGAMRSMPEMSVFVLIISMDQGRDVIVAAIWLQSGGLFELPGSGGVVHQAGLRRCIIFVIEPE